MLGDFSGLSPEQIAEWARDDEGRSYLLLSAFEAALAARARQKIRALARVVADGIQYDDRVEYSTVIVDALGQVEQTHLQVLRAMVSDGEQRPPAASGQPVNNDTWATSQLATHLPGLAPAIVPIAMVLVRTGMAAQGTIWVDRDDATWVVTQFGRDCLNHLMEVAAEEAPG
jgi:hypothetical protein